MQLENGIDLQYYRHCSVFSSFFNTAKLILHFTLKQPIFQKKLSIGNQHHLHLDGCLASYGFGRGNKDDRQVVCFLHL